MSPSLLSWTPVPRGRFLLGAPLPPVAAATAVATVSGSAPPPPPPAEGEGDDPLDPAAAPPARRAAAAAAAPLLLLLPPAARPEVAAEEPNRVRTCPGAAAGEVPGLPELPPPLPLLRGLAAGGVRGPPRVCTPPALPPPPLVPLEAEAEPASLAVAPPPPPLLPLFRPPDEAAVLSPAFFALPVGFFLTAGPPEGSELLRSVSSVAVVASPAPAAAAAGVLDAREELRVDDDEVVVVVAAVVLLAVFARLERPHFPPCWMPAVWVARRTVTLSLSDSLPPISASSGMSSGLLVVAKRGRN